MKDLKLDEHTGLVLEGGGMRGVFTCGVLDYLMDHDIRFPYAIGVSAGACNGLSYASRQRGRAKFSNIDLLEKYNYIGLKHLLRKRNILDFDLLFNEFPEAPAAHRTSAQSASETFRAPQLHLHLSIFDISKFNVLSNIDIVKYTAALSVR